MMKILLAICLTFPFLATAQVKTPAKTKAPVKGFIIRGEVSGLKKGADVKLVSANTNAELATAVVQEKSVVSTQKGKKVTTITQTFELKGSVPEADLYVLSVGDLKPYNLFVENSVITIKGKSNDMVNWVVNGSKSQKDFQDFEKIFTPLASNLNATTTMINSTGPGASRDSLMKNYTAIQESIQTQIDNYVTSRSSSNVAPFVMLVLMNFNSDPVLAEKRFNKLTPQVQGSYLGKVLSDQIADNKVGAVGTQALEFSQADTSGQMISLSSFRGKYVLVDFWASWCGPCRDENPNVVKNFEQFKGKNFTVLGVSLDRPGQKDKWLQAIKDDGLTWTHVSDLKFWENEVARLYKVQGIPQNILVDPTGKIIGKNLRGPDLEEKLCEFLGCN